MDTRLARLFPNLTPASYGAESPASKKYNCIAYAAGITERWWQPPCSSPPDPELRYDWPKDAPAGNKLSAYVGAYQTIGYVESNNGEFEDGYEKLAIYSHQTIENEVHAARQLQNGWWVSKVGRYKDLEHATAEVIESQDGYKLVKWMKRLRKQ